MPASAASIDARSQQLDECLRQIAVLPAEAWVSIVDDRVLSRLRLRRLAHRAGLVIERELVVLPTGRAGAAVVEDVAGPTFPGPVPNRSARTLPWSWTRWLAPQRVLVARRP